MSTLIATLMRILDLISAEINSFYLENKIFNNKHLFLSISTSLYFMFYKHSTPSPLYLHGSREDMQEHMAHHFHSACRGWALLGVSTPLPSPPSLFSSTVAYYSTNHLPFFFLCTQVDTVRTISTQCYMRFCTSALLVLCHKIGGCKNINGSY